jgi:hypothetical protein
MAFGIEGMNNPQLAELNEDMMAKLLTSKSEESRIKGRLLATSLIEHLRDFAHAEYDRETRPHLVLMAINEVIATYIGSMIVGAAREPRAARMAAQVIGKEYFDYLNKLVEMATEKKK